MDLLTLRDINNDFMAGIREESQNSQDSKDRQDTELKPIKPLLIKIEPPETGTNAVRTEQKRKKKKKNIFFIAADSLFYILVIAVFVSVLVSGIDGGKPKSILGYSYFTVISGSMEDEIPEGSLIFVKETDTGNLKVGDNITFIRGQYDPVTHQIADIIESHDVGGSRGFITKGVNNESPDRDPVYEADVIGKVTLVLPRLGTALYYLSENIVIMFVLLGLFTVISFFIRGMSARAV